MFEKFHNISFHIPVYHICFTVHSPNVGSRDRRVVGVERGLPTHWAEGRCNNFALGKVSCGCLLLLLAVVHGCCRSRKFVAGQSCAVLLPSCGPSGTIDLDSIPDQVANCCNSKERMKEKKNNKKIYPYKWSRRTFVVCSPVAVATKAMGEGVGRQSSVSRPSAPLTFTINVRRPGCIIAASWTAVLIVVWAAARAVALKID